MTRTKKMIDGSYKALRWRLPTERCFYAVRAEEVRFKGQNRKPNGQFDFDDSLCKNKSFAGVDKSANSGIIKIGNEFQNSVKGVKAANGTTVNSISEHAKIRMIQRNVTVSDIKDTLQNPYVTYRSKTDYSCSIFDKGRTHVVLNDNGNIVTVAVNKTQK